MSPDAIGQSVRWGEAWALTLPIILDPYSQLSAAVLGWTRPPHPVEESIFTLMDFYQSAHRKKNAPQIKPLERPWRTPREAVHGPARSATEKAVGRRRLQERLGLTPATDK